MFRVRSLGVAAAAWSSAVALPRGPKGVPGATGVSPLVKVEHQDGATTITVTDRDGTTTSTIPDGVTDAYTRAEVDAKLSAVYRYRGTVGSYAELPTEGNEVGDVWNVSAEDEEHLLKAGDNVAWTADGTWDALSGQVDLTPFARKAEAATDHNHDEQYLKLTGGTVTGTVYATAVNAVDSLSEGGVKLSDKYAAKSHTHEVADVTGLQAALDAKADADTVPASAVTYAETLPTASENAPGCVIVTGATSETQTRGHVYALTASTGVAVRNLNITVAGDSRMTGTYLYHGLFRGSHSWVSSSLADYAGTGGNTGNIVLWRGSDNGYWYFTDKNNPNFETVGALYTRHETDNPLDITETGWSDGESGTLTVTIADGGEGYPALNFTSVALGETIAMYRKGTTNDRPRWESQDTISGRFKYELVWEMSSWRLRCPDADTYPESIVNSADSPLELSGQTWTSVCTLEEVSPASGGASYAYKDITVAELDALRSAVAALEARVAALGG